MPYGCLDSKTLSAASVKSIERALEEWQRSMQVSRPKTLLVLAAYEENLATELALRRDLARRVLSEEELTAHVVEITAKNEEELATKIARNKTCCPIQTLILFAESRNLLSLRPIFKRKFGKALEIKKFKADFEFNHPWISTSTSLAWFFRNFNLGIWINLRNRMNRRLRKTLRYLFWS
jgi:hypothetical protein